MALPLTHADAGRPPLRLWPAYVIAAAQLLAQFVLPRVMDGPVYGLLGGFFGGALILLWWLLLSRAAWRDRLGVVAVAAAALFVTYRLVHPSIAGGGMGMMLAILATPWIGLAIVLWAAASRGLDGSRRAAALVAAMAVACGPWTLLRTGGISGEGESDFHWRWTPSPEERLIAGGVVARVTPKAASSPASVVDPASGAASAGTTSAGEAPAARGSGTARGATSVATATAAADDARERTPEWPGFRGPERASIVRGARIDTNWEAAPPRELWRKPLGPGWSSFAVDGNRLYTQEQLGENEVVACYDARTGEPIWKHADAARFWESNGGAGPRATPLLHRGRVYALGATGLLNALDAATGAVVWSRNAAAETGAPLPAWGFSGSPIVAKTGASESVVVATSGRLIAYDTATGQKRWTAAGGGGSYSSPHVATLAGVEQILMVAGSGIAAFAPQDGALLWKHEWAGVPIVQPALTDDGDILISVSDSSGTRRLGLSRGASGWSVSERWTSNGLKAYFNDFVVHGGHAYGFDGAILACIDLLDGKRKWKGGRFGHGQLVLLPEQDLLLVISEGGELALVSATPQGFAEVARFKAIEGKTWNHPALVDGVLYARNGEEMAAFRLAAATGAGAALAPPPPR